MKMKMKMKMSRCLLRYQYFIVSFLFILDHALFKRVEKVLNRKWYMYSLVDGIW